MRDVKLDVKRVLRDLDEARFALQAGDSRSAAIHLECALGAVESHRRGDEVVVQYVPEPCGEA